MENTEYWICAPPDRNYPVKSQQNHQAFTRLDGVHLAK